jgi:membrane glycosyltransferase
MLPEPGLSPTGGDATARTEASIGGTPVWRRAARVRRALLTAVVLAQTLAGSYFLTRVLPYHGGNAVELGLLALFVLLFAWISVGFWIGVTGFLLRCTRGDRHSLLRRHRKAELAAVPLARTAVVMPIYHEPVERTFDGLRATVRSLQCTGQMEHFDVFILSDSRDPDVWLREREAWHRLCAETGAGGRLFYRRRPVNLHYKSGNIADFLRRWGRGYRYMIVLDADSLMQGDTLVTMVQLMEREPRVGILQTSPGIVNGQSLFARVQQFANQVYGPLFTTGLAAYQLGEAAYWGHNAIIRTAPFMRHCGLRTLRGPGLFRGPISSHDFVEAAFMGRAGYEVWLEPGLRGSYEESPPTLVDELTRDRRWAKGNLQHLWLLLTEPGLRAAHRMALINGIMSYLASPLWFAFLVLTSITVARVTLMPIEYFPEPHRLFPLWPEWNPRWAIGLAGATVFLLFFPKLLAALDVVLTRRLADHGGAGRTGASVLLEMLVSTLLAPIRMLAHTRYVLEALLNTTLRWAGQNRSEETRWRDAFANQAPGMVLALAWSGFAWWLDPVFFYWTLPVALPLMLAAPTSVLLGRVRLGQRLRDRGLLMTAQERRPEALLETFQHAMADSAPDTSPSAFTLAVLDPMLNRIHRACVRQARGGARGRRVADLVERCLAQGPQALSRRDLCTLADDAGALKCLHDEAWCAPPGTYWGDALGTHLGAGAVADRGR